MRVITSLGVFTGIAWLTSAAVVPRQASGSTCSTNPGTIFVTVTEPNTVPPSIIFETVISTVSVATTTVTITPGGAGSPNVAGSSSCSSAVDASGQASLAAPGSVGSLVIPDSPNVHGTSTTSFSDSFAPSASQVPAGVPAVVTVTLDPGLTAPTSTNAGTSNEASSTCTTGSDAGLGKATTTLFSTSYLTVNTQVTISQVTVTKPMATITVPGGAANPGAGSPGLGNPGSGDTTCAPVILTIPAGSGNPLGSAVTLTVYPTSLQSVTTKAPIPSSLLSPGGFIPSTSCVESDITPGATSPAGPASIALTSAPSPDTSASSAVVPTAAQCAPVFVTYTLPQEPGQTSCSTGVATITPLPPCPQGSSGFAPTSPVAGSGNSGVPVGPLQSGPAIVTVVTETVSASPSSSSGLYGPGPFGVSSSPTSSSQFVPVASPFPSISAGGNTGQGNPTASLQPSTYGSTQPEAFTVAQQSTITVQETLVSVPAPTSLGSGGFSAGPSIPNGAGDGGSIVEVTYTVPGGYGSASSTYTVTYTQEPTPAVTVTVPAGEQTIPLAQPSVGSGSYSTPPSASNSMGSSPDSGPVVTYTIPSGSGSSPEIFTLTYNPSTDPASVTGVPPAIISGQPSTSGALSGYGSPTDGQSITTFSLSASPSPSQGLGPEVVTVTPLGATTPVVVTFTPGESITFVPSTANPDESSSLPSYGGQDGPATSPGAGSDSAPNVVTIPLASGSGIVVTLPSGLSTGSANGQDSWTSPTGQPSPSVLTIGPPSPSVIVVTATVPGYGSNNGGSAGLSTRVPSASPVVVTYTLPSQYGQDPTGLTLTTNIPLPSPTHSSGSVITLTLQAPTGAGQQSEVTIWPTTSTSPSFTVLTVLPNGQSLTSCSTLTGQQQSGGAGQSPSVITLWPSSTMVTSTISGSTTCSSDEQLSPNGPPTGSQSGGNQPWQSQGGSSSTCTTFQTSYTPSHSEPSSSGITGLPVAGGTQSGSIESSSSCTEESSGQSSATAVSQAPTSNASSGPDQTSTDQSQATDQSQDTLTDAPTLWPSQTKIPASKAAATDSQNPDQTMTDQSQATDQSQDTPVSQPAQSQPFSPTSIASAASTTAASSSVLGMYSFSGQQYETALHQYGTDLPTLSSATSMSSSQSASGIAPVSGSVTQTSTATSTTSPASSEPNSTTLGTGPLSTSSASLTGTALSNATTSEFDTAASAFPTSTNTLSKLSSSNTTGPVISASITAAPLSTPAANTTTDAIATPTANATSEQSVSSWPESTNTTGVSLSTGPITATPSETAQPSTLNNTAGPTLTDLSSITGIASTFGSSPTGVNLTTSSISEFNSTSTASSTMDVNSTATATGASFSSEASATTRALNCGNFGDRGDFTLNFDDIPQLQVFNDMESSPVRPMPVPSPYHRFEFTAGFKVAPPPTARFSPSSGNLMVQHASSADNAAQFGIHPLIENSCFHFTFKGASLGCNSTNLACIFNVTGIRNNGNEDIVQSSKIFEVPACRQDADCTLIPRVVDPGDGYSDLTAVNITLTVGGQPQTWWADDIKLSWSDNSCNAGSCRSQVPNTIMVQTSRLSRAVQRATSLLRWARRAGRDE